MLDLDISTDDALRLLSSPNQRDEAGDLPGPRGWNRRQFLRAVGLGVGAGLSLGTLGDSLFGHEVPDAWAGSPIGAGDGILVNIMLFGGNDGLDMIVPYTNGTYYTQRKAGGVAVAASSVLPLDGSYGLPPTMPYVKALWDAGQVGVIHGVGYNPADLSHFSSMAIWMNGRFGGGAPTTGWLGRWLDDQPEASAQFAAATVGSSVPLHLIGANRRALGVPESGGMFGSDTDVSSRRMYDGISAMANASGGRGPWFDAFSSTMRTTITVAGELSPAFSPDITGSEFVQKLTMAARLINRNIGFRVVDIGVSGFDTHDGEPWRQAQLLQDFNDGVQAFYATLDPTYRNRVTLMTGSEFGRTAWSNDSGGTDHGTSNAHLVIGANVKGGMYGQAPPLTQAAHQWDRLVSIVDFRAMYGSVLDGWLGGGASTILNGSFENLNLFRAAPGVESGAVLPPTTTPIVVPPGVIEPAPPTIAPTVATEFVPLSPLRIIDTRDGTGGRNWQLQPGETMPYGIAVDATEPTFITVFGMGNERPDSSNINPVPGMAVPNMVVSRIGATGAVSFYNLKGAVSLVADLVGYFRKGSSVGMVPLAPQRLLDTRDGTGGFNGKVGVGASIDLLVTGRGGVPGNATAVVLNVTVTQPDAPSFLTVWPTGEVMPVASSVNMVAGQTVPNMVTAKIGKGGKVSIYNLAGNTHVVVDVLGCYSPGASGRFVAVGPVRLLDTRMGLGSAKQRLGQTPLSLKIRGRVGIPASGVSAVLLNLTAVEPTADTFVTVYPGASALPTASNLNAVAGQIVPNMVLARLGPEGDVMLFNYAGTVDLVADITGYFTS
jgi:uncharacterized protein (DUF1501 family)